MDQENKQLFENFWPLIFCALPCSDNSGEDGGFS